MLACSQSNGAAQGDKGSVWALEGDKKLWQSGHGVHILKMGQVDCPIQELNGGSNWVVTKWQLPTPLDLHACLMVNTPQCESILNKCWKLTRETESWKGEPHLRTGTRKRRQQRIQSNDQITRPIVTQMYRQQKLQ